MNVKYEQRISAVFLLGVMLAAISASCAMNPAKAGFDIKSVRSYRDIPGITEADIAGIEKLKSEKDFFVYGSDMTMEAFILPDGDKAGFTAMFCDLLSELFDIPFSLGFYSWDEMMPAIDNHSIDFTGELTPTPERSQSYIMSHPITERTLAIFFNNERMAIESERDLYGLTIGFYEGTITRQYVSNFYPGLLSKTVEFSNADEAAELLKTGRMDAFIAEAVEILYYGQYPFITSIDALPLVYTPVSMTTANPELRPVISAVNKYLESGGVRYLYELYHAGRNEFIKHKLALSFTDEEKAYIENLVARGTKAPVALEPDNYPICFFDEENNRFSGIVPDILAEVSLLTGIEFEAITGKDTTFSEALEMLKSGEAALISQLLHTAQWEGDYIWTAEPFYVSHIAFLSRIDYPYLELFQIAQSNVGLVDGTAYVDMYREWFPNDGSFRVYGTTDKALDALERGEIDLFMTSEYIILYQTNFREKVGFKVNVTMNTMPSESFFGFTKHEEILRDIIDKVLKNINAEKITRSWMNRTYDNAKRMAEQRTFYLTVFVSALTLMLVIVLVLYRKNKKTGDIYKEQAVTIERQNDLLITANAASKYLLEPDASMFEENLQLAMGELARAVKVDRVGIWKNTRKDGRLYCTMTYEWVDDAVPMLGSGFATDLSYDDTFPGWEETLSLGNYISVLTREAPTEDQEYYGIWGIISFFVVPVLVHDEFWGFACFDDCRQERIFEENEKLILHSASSMIANALIRNDMTQRILETSVRLEEAVAEANESKKEAEQSSRYKSDFLAKMSHEIRTPMNAIIGMAELALRENTPKTIHEHIFTVKQAGANLLAIINDILDFSKIESGALLITPLHYHFSSLINDVVSIIRMRVIDTQIRFSVNIDCSIPNALIGDEVRLRQVLINVLGNAVKYTEKGFVSFSAYKESIDGDVVNLAIKISDSGRGIKKEDMENLFSEYIQVDMDRNKGIEGVGLGLAIAHNIINAMGGGIGVHSEYGKGSTFTITLPQKFRNPEKLASVENPENIRVIIYEPRKVYANSIAFTVENLGVYCVITGNDTELYKGLSRNEFSHIFISYELYKKFGEIIHKMAESAKIVLLTEFGETIHNKNMSSLAMPAHSISIANILNGIPDEYSYSENDESIARFIAPDAAILIVDDINANLKVAKGLLMPYQMRVDLCTSGAEAIFALKSERYDLVFMDHRMPDMDGVEATGIIRGMGGKDPYYQSLPIIALTANAVSGTREMFLKNGFNDFLSKPIDTVRLDIILEKWLPKEKQKSAVAEHRPSAGAGRQHKRDEKNSFEAAGIEIAGIDAAKGISISGGAAALYLDVLAAFYKDGRERILIIKKHLDSGNLPAYTTHVHGLKSALYNIGADALSESAKSLEAAAERKDTDYIYVHNPVFLSDLESLLVRVKSCLSKQAANEDGTGGPSDVARFREELVALKEAFSVMDRGAINKALINLQELAPSEEYAAAVKAVANKIIMAEYAEAEELIDSLGIVQK